MDDMYAQCMCIYHNPFSSLSLGPTINVNRGSYSDSALGEQWGYEGLQAITKNPWSGNTGRSKFAQFTLKESYYPPPTSLLFLRIPCSALAGTAGTSLHLEVSRSRSNKRYFVMIVCRICDHGLCCMQADTLKHVAGTLRRVKLGEHVR